MHVLLFRDSSYIADIFLVFYFKVDDTLKKIIHLLLLCLAVNMAFAQSPECTLSLYGKVIDDHDQQPLAFAAVYISELQKGAVTDSAGNYYIGGICPGTYTVKCTHLGCNPLEVKLTIKRNLQKNFYPEHHAEELGRVEIQASREDVPTQASSELEGRKLDETRGRSLGDALKDVTGVATIQTGSSISKPIIHGMHSNRILVLNNGIRQEGQQWGLEHAPEVDPFIAGKLSVVKGANSVRYGSDAMAGIILVEPRPLRDSAGIGGELNLAGFSNGRQGAASAMLEGNFKKLPALSWRTQGTLKRSGNIKTPGYYLKNTGMEEHNFSVAAAFNKKRWGTEVFYSQFNTKLGIFSGSHIGNLTDLQHAFEMGEPLETSGFSYEIGRPYQQAEHELLKLQGHTWTGKAGKLQIVYARQYNLRMEYDKHLPLNDSLAALGLPDLKYEITTHTGDMTWEHVAVKNISGSIGVNGITQGNTYEGRFFIPNYRNYGAGAFWIERWKKNKLELEGGARYDYRWLKVYKRLPDNSIYSPEFNYNNVSGTVGAIYTLKDGVSFNVNAGTAWRAPAVNELFSNGLHHGAASIETGNENLAPETALNFIATGSYKPEGKKLSAELSVYYNIIENYIYQKPQLPPALTVHGAFPAFSYQQANATFKGLDAMAGYYITKQLSVTGKASIVRAFNESVNEYFVLIPPDRYEAEMTYELRDRKKLRNAYISLSATHVAKQWRVPANSDFAPPPAAYTLAGLEAGFSVPIKKQEVTIGFSVTNLFDTKYRDYLDRFRYYSDAPGRSVNLRLKVPFEIITNKPSHKPTHNTGTNDKPL